VKSVLISGIFALLAMTGGAEAQNVASAKRQMIQEAIQRYPGNCPCPYSRASNGSRCGGRSAWTRPGGRSPLCYGDDISQSMVNSWMQRNGMSVSINSGRTSNAEKQTILEIQTQLNRLGCNLGTPDGVIGPNSRAALKNYSDAQGIAFVVSNFRSQLFLRRIGRVQNQVCD
jgi:hypothetical protein